MKKKVKITTEICGMPRLEGRYIILISYVQGGCIFTCDNYGKGFDLKAAQDYAFTMRDHIKSDE